jgi:hypothetical protein
MRRPSFLPEEILVHLLVDEEALDATRGDVTTQYRGIGIKATLLRNKGHIA